LSETRLKRALTRLLPFSGISWLDPRDGLDAARARGRTGGQKPKLTDRQAKIARDMYDELGPDGRRVHTVQQIADEFGVTRPTIYRHLQRSLAEHQRTGR